MLRLAHTQVSTGGIIVNDIDDGLPNKTAKRGTGDKDKYIRDGNSLGGHDRSTKPGVNNPKQKCYIPFWKILSNNPPTYSSTVAGYIDVAETDRVLISQDRGVIHGLATKTPSALITVTSFTAADVAAPTITSANMAAGDGVDALTMVVTNALSLAPDISSVKIGTTVITKTQITGAGGTFTDTSIIIPKSLIPTSMIIGTTTITVTADNQTTAPHAIAVTNTAPTIATAVIGGGNLTLVGTGFLSILPNLTSVTTTGHVGTMTAANILAHGSISDTTIVIPTATTTGYPAGLTTGDTVLVHANSLVTLTPATI
jgi:hypothetical protein